MENSKQKAISRTTLKNQINEIRKDVKQLLIKGSAHDQIALDMKKDIIEITMELKEQSLKINNLEKLIT